MSLAIADSSKFVGALKPTFTREQAEQLFRALSLVGREPSQGQAATGLEIKELELKIEEARKEIKELEKSIRKELKELEQSTRREIKELELKIEEARKEIKELEQSTRREIRELDANTQKSIKEIERGIGELELKVAETRTQIALSKAEVLKWMGGFLVAQTGIIATLIKFM